MSNVPTNKRVTAIGSRDLLSFTSDPSSLPAELEILFGDFLKSIRSPINKRLNGPIRNVFTRHIPGIINKNGSPTTLTYHVIAACPFDFTHARPILKNLEATPPNAVGCVIAASNNAASVVPSSGNTLTNDPAAGWSSVTKNGATSFALTAPGTDARDAGILLPDWIEKASILATDGTGNRYIHCRIKFDAAYSYLTTPTIAASNPTHQYFNKTFSQSVDGVTDPSVMTTGNGPGTPTPIFGFEFLCDKGIVQVGCVGNSITQGLYADQTTAGVGNDSQMNSWVVRAGEDLTAAGVPVNMINFGWSGSTTTSYAIFGKKAITNHGLNIVMYSIFSPNDGTPTQAIVDTQYRRAMDFANYALANNCLPIFTILAPMATLTAAQDAYRISLIEKIKSKGFVVCDMLAVVGNSNTPQGWKTGMNADTWHPNTNGHNAMYPVAVSMIKDILAQNILW